MQYSLKNFSLLALLLASFLNAGKSYSADYGYSIFSNHRHNFESNYVAPIVANYTGFGGANFGVSIGKEVLFHKSWEENFGFHVALTLYDGQVFHSKKPVYGYTKFGLKGGGTFGFQYYDHDHNSADRWVYRFSISPTYMEYFEVATNKEVKRFLGLIGVGIERQFVESQRDPGNYWSIRAMIYPSGSAANQIVSLGVVFAFDALSNGGQYGY